MLGGRFQMHSIRDIWERIERQGQTRRKAGTQSYRSKGLEAYDSGVATPLYV